MYVCTFIHFGHLILDTHTKCMRVQNVQNCVCVCVCVPVCVCVQHYYVYTRFSVQ